MIVFVDNYEWVSAISLAIVGEHTSIRINGIDTPEIRGKCDKESN